MSPKVELLETVVKVVRAAQRSRDPREKLAAVELEIEFTERLEAERRRATGDAPQAPVAHAA